MRDKIFALSRQLEKAGREKAWTGELARASIFPGSVEVIYRGMIKLKV